MRPLWTILAGSVVALTAVACGSSAGEPAGTGAPNPESGPADKVVTKLLAFDPEKLTVKAGTTVTWEVSDAITHTVTTGTFSVGGDGLRTDEEPDGVVDKPLTHHDPVSFTFDEPGTYIYYCSIHKGMNGEVEVTP